MAPPTRCTITSAYVWGVLTSSGVPVFQYGPQESSHLLDKVKVNWQYEEAKKK